MTKLCIIDFEKDGLVFCKGLKYKVDFNKVDGRLYIVRQPKQLNLFEK